MVKWRFPCSGSMNTISLENELNIQVSNHQMCVFELLAMSCHCVWDVSQFMCCSSFIASAVRPWSPTYSRQPLSNGPFYLSKSYTHTHNSSKGARNLVKITAFSTEASQGFKVVLDFPASHSNLLLHSSVPMLTQGTAM